jgi:hypothetical protein
MIVGMTVTATIAAAGGTAIGIATTTVTSA